MPLYSLVIQSLINSNLLNVKNMLAFIKLTVNKYKENKSN